MRNIRERIDDIAIPKKLESYFGKGTLLQGTLKFNGSLRYDGEFKGKIISDGTIYVGNSGKLDATITTGTLLNSGNIFGDIIAKEIVYISSSGQLQGNINTPVLKMDPGAIFNGNCSMPENVLKPSDSSKAAGTLKKDRPAHPPLSEPEVKEAIKEEIIEKNVIASNRQTIFKGLIILLLIFVGVLFWVKRDILINKWTGKNYYAPVNGFLKKRLSGSDVLLKKGIKLKEDGNTTEALKIFRKIASRKNSIQTTLSLARNFVEMESQADYLSEYEKAISLDPSNIETKTEFLQILIRKELYEKAIIQLKEIIALNETDIKPHLELAQIYKKMGKEDDQYNEHLAILKIKPDHEETLLSLAEMQFSRKSYKEAKENYEKVLKLNPNAVAANFGFSMVKFITGNEYQAEAGFLKVQHLDSDHIEVLNNEGFRLIGLKKADDAMAVFENVLKKDKQNIRAKFGIVTALTRKGFLRGAIKECEDFLALYPDIVPFQNRLAWLYGQKKINLDKAIELSKKTLVANPKSSDYLDTLSFIYYAKGDKEKAIEYIQKAIELNPESVYYKNQLKKFQS